MPTYVYRCTRGSHEFEQVQKITDPPTATCPECGEPAERVISGGAGLLFKGSGFYITDYRTPTYKEAEKKEKEKGDVGAGSKPASDSAKKDPGPEKKGKKEAKEGTS
jgi:putative FmdB family regulatory protein